MASVFALAELSWERVRQLDLSQIVALLPVGSTEAHGPHLPLNTDVIIAEAMVRSGAEQLATEGLDALILPPISYSVTEFAAGFAGTISIRPETASRLMVDVAAGLARHGVQRLGIANAHLEPGHIASIRSAVDEIRAQHGLTVAFPDVTRKPWALRLTDEFKSGACHAGCYEGSVVLAERPDLVDEVQRARLEPNQRSLSDAIRAGQTSFEEAGGPLAYFGDPAAASAAEGRETIQTLGAILAEAVRRECGLCD